MSHRRTLASVISLICAALALSLGSCGGSSSGSTGPTGQIFIGGPSGAATGYIYSNGSFSPVVRLAQNGWTFGVGDDAIESTVYGFMRFVVSGFSSSTVIHKATLRLPIHQIDGTPFADLGGRIVVDMVDLGSTLDVSDYTAPAIIQAGVALLAPMTSGTYEVDVTQLVRDARTAGSFYVELRFRYETLSDGQSDTDLCYFTTFESGLVGTHIEYDYTGIVM